MKSFFGKKAILWSLLLLLISFAFSSSIAPGEDCKADHCSVNESNEQPAVEARSLTNDHLVNFFKGKRVALHAQASASTNDYVSGSEYTCRGLKAAIQRMGASHVRIFSTGMYGPTCEDTTSDGSTSSIEKCSNIDDSNAWDQWDIVIIEGWFDMISSFINLIRSPSPASESLRMFTQPIVLYYCLDIYSDYYLDKILRLNVDAYLTNSAEMKRILSQKAPTLMMHLAAIAKNDIHARETKSTMNDQEHILETQRKQKYSHNIVYVGQWTEKKRHLVNMLREAKPFGLAVYGFGWNQTEFRDIYKGILPVQDLISVYEYSKVAIGCTDDLQKTYGMINNRVFEVLATGTTLINDHFDELEKLFPEADKHDSQLLFYRKPGDVTKHLQRLFSEKNQGQNPEKSSNMISNAHTYAHRSRDLAIFLQDMASAKAFVPGTVNAFRLAVIIFKKGGFSPTDPDNTFDAGFVRALDILKTHLAYNITWINLADYCTNIQTMKVNDTLEIDFDVTLIEGAFDAIIVKSNWNWYPDSFSRSFLVKNDEKDTNTDPRMILAVSGVADPPDLNEMLKYDLLIHETFWYEKFINHHPQIQHAFGVDTTGMNENEEPVEKVWDYLGIGSIVWYKRPLLMCKKKGRRAWIGEITDESLANEMKANGIVILPFRSNKELGKVIRSSKTVYIPANIQGGGERAVLEAIACGVKVEVEPDNEKLQELASLGKTHLWDEYYYANQIQAAITRTLAFGRARADIQMINPEKSIVLKRPTDHQNSNILGWYLWTKPKISFFEIGKEGFWCVHSICNADNFIERKLCMGDNRLDTFLFFPFPPKNVGASEYICEVFLSLRGNIFVDTIRESNRISVTVLGDKNQNAQILEQPIELCGPNVKADVCKQLIARTNPYFKVDYLPNFWSNIPATEITQKQVENINLTASSNTHFSVEIKLDNVLSRRIWMTEENHDLVAPTRVHFHQYGENNQSHLLEAKLRLWGQGSLSRANSVHRSFVLDFDNPNSQKEQSIELDGQKVSRLVFLSLFEDEYKLKYATSIRLMESISINDDTPDPLWKAKSTLVKLLVEKNESVYLVVEHPYDVAKRLGAVDVAQRDLDDQIQEVSYDQWGPGSNEKRSDLVEQYNNLMSTGGLLEFNEEINTDAYLKWLAVNTLLHNGDYIDEVFFYTTKGNKKMNIIPWDYDSVFKECHMNGERAVKESPLFFCAESRLDHFIAATQILRNRVSDQLKSLLSWVTPRVFCKQYLYGTLDKLEKLDKKNSLSYREGYANICTAYEETYTLLWDSFMQPDSISGEPDLETTIPHNGAGRSLRGDTEYGLYPWHPKILLDNSRAHTKKTTITAELFPVTWPENAGPLPLVISWESPVKEAETLVSVKYQCSDKEIQHSYRSRYGRKLAAIDFPIECRKGDERPSSFSIQIPNHSAMVKIVPEHRVKWQLLCISTGQDAIGVIDNEVWEENSRIIVPSGGCRVPSSISLVIGAGSILLMEEGSFVGVGNGSAFILKGSKRHPIIMTTSHSSRYWRGIITEGSHSHIEANFSIFMRSGHGLGVSSNTKYTHRREQALFEIYDNSILSLRGCYLGHGKGQAFSVSGDSNVHIESSTIRGFVAGGEMFHSKVHIDNTILSDFPSDDSRIYSDEDNDALYLVGGEANIARSTFGLAKDDCIDSGTGNGGFINITGCLFDSCQHEGVAITNRPGEHKKVVNIRQSVFRNNQQGVELGWSTSDTVVSVTDCSFIENQVGVRFGDNYEAKVEGFLFVSNSNFSGAFQKHSMMLVRDSENDRRDMNMSTHFVVNNIFVSRNGNLEYFESWEPEDQKYFFRADSKTEDLILDMENKIELEIAVTSDTAPDQTILKYIEGDDIHLATEKACGTKEGECAKQVIAYIHNELYERRMANLPEVFQPRIMLTIPVNMQNGEQKQLKFRCGDDVMHRIERFCKGNGQGYLCVKALLNGFRERLLQQKDPCSESRIQFNERFQPESISETTILKVLDLETSHETILQELNNRLDIAHESFTLVEHSSSKHSCTLIDKLVRRFPEKATAVCLGSNESEAEYIKNVDAQEPNYLLCRKPSLPEMFRSPDMVNFQFCINECPYTNSIEAINMLVSLSAVSVIHFGSTLNSNEVFDKLFQASVVPGNELSLMVFELGGPGLWMVENRGMERPVKHHYNADAADGWLGVHYRVLLEADGRISARRERDHKLIRYRHLGLSLNTILEMDPSPVSRKYLTKSFATLAVTEDMAPWNILYTNKRSLVYIDSETLQTSDLNANYMYSIIKLNLQCNALLALYRVDPVAAFQKCLFQLA